MTTAVFTAHKQKRKQKPQQPGCSLVFVQPHKITLIRIKWTFRFFFFLLRASYIRVYMYECVYRLTLRACCPIVWSSFTLTLTESMKFMTDFIWFRLDYIAHVLTLRFDEGGPNGNFFLFDILKCITYGAKKLIIFRDITKSQYKLWDRIPGTFVSLLDPILNFLVKNPWED